MKFRSAIPLLITLASVVAHNNLPAQPYGLDVRPSVSEFFDGTLPPEPPASSSTWTAVVAFPDLHFDNAMGLLPVPGTSKLVVWTREGRIFEFENHPEVTDAEKTLILDISNQCQGWDDMGLLNMAFHPDFQTNRYMYVFYCWVPPGTVFGSPTKRPPNGTNFRQRLSRFTINDSGIADPDSELVIIDQGAHNTWHNGGGMFFHPVNGFLYLTNGNDNNGQNNQVINRGMFGCVIRIDVDKTGGNISHPPVKRAFEEVSANWPQYYVPNDNPFVGVAGAVEEIYSLGLRSPHRMTIDPVSNRIFIADVGEGSREEVNVIEPSDPPGLNFQWNRIEGYNGDLAEGTHHGVNKRPILDYGHNGEGGRAIIGGYVYRGSEFPELAGKYIFSDNISRHVWMMDESTHTPTTPATKVLLATIPRGTGANSGSDYLGISSLGHDANHELYFCQMGTGSDAEHDGGRIYKLQRQGEPPFHFLPPTLSETGAFDNIADLTPSEKMIPYELNAPFWSDGTIKSRWAVIPSGSAVDFTPTGDWTYPTGSVFVKHFELPVDDTDPAIRRRLETRLLVRMAEGGSYGVTYKWRADQSDADLIDVGLTENIPIKIAPLGALSGADLGLPAMVGSTESGADTVTITASGSDISETSDQGHFASRQRSGDFDIAVRVESLVQSGLYAKAGLMARESLEAGSRQVFAFVFPSNGNRDHNTGGYQFQFRANPGENSVAIYPPVPQPKILFPNGWIRLLREGDTFVAYSGTDGISWSEFARQTIEMPDTLYFGYAATAGSESQTTVAVFHPQTERYQPWNFPGRADCVTCHNPNAGGGILGPSARQLNKEMLYPASGVTDNELRTWAHIGLFNHPPAESEIPTLKTMVAVENTSASLEKRARSYFDTNCAYCHRPGGAQAFWDARYDTPLEEQGIIYGEVASDLGIPESWVVTPQDLMHSNLFQRINKVGKDQMPPISRYTIDKVAVDTISQWIQSLTPADPPVVHLDQPAEGATYMRLAQVPISATASDPHGISRVEFHQGENLLGSATNPPYTITWDNPPLGNFPITATAYSNLGISKQSPPAAVHLVNPPVTFERHINFETTNTLTPAGYLKDDGSPFSSERGYGWSRDNTADARAHNTPEDLRLATLVHLQKNGPSTWELAVPDGYYEIHMVAGDAVYSDGYMQLSAEETIIVDGKPNSANHWVQGTGGVMVTDGRLTIASGPKAVNNKISFIDINRISIPPSVAFTEMAEHVLHLDTDTIVLHAEASDSDGTISRVEFWDGSIKLGEDSSPPYSWSWNGPVSIGNHLLKSFVYDNDGRVTASKSITIEVVPLSIQLTGVNESGARLLQSRFPAGRNYTVWYSHDLNQWYPFHSGSSDAMNLILEDDTTVDRRFYRISVDP